MSMMTDFHLYTRAEIEQLVSKSSPEQIQSTVSKMTVQQIDAAVTSLSSKKDPLSKEKTRAVIHGLEERHQLEAAGSALLAWQALDIFDQYDTERSDYWKLAPLLVGISRHVFFEMLKNASGHHLQILKHEGVIEPVQHHLTLLASKMTAFTNELGMSITTLEQEISQIEATNLGFTELYQFIDNIEQLSVECWSNSEIIDRALAIAWNTDRLDLIENLSLAKEKCQRLLLTDIGHPQSPSERATGLYATLENRLYAVYDIPEDPKLIHALHDNTPVMEALGKFSIWYLQDYFELGLLPNVKTVDELDLSLKSHTLKECQEHRHKLFSEARHQLEKLGLRTVKDLKQAFIFSHKALKQYISNNGGLSEPKTHP